MNTKKKPSWLLPLDFVSFAVPGIVCLVLLVVGLVHGASGPRQWPYLMGLVGAVFLAIWVRVALLRRAYLDGFRWYPAYGVMAEANGYLLPNDEQMDAAVRADVSRWALYYGTKAADAVASDVVWCFFKKDLSEADIGRADVRMNGFTIARSHTMYVSYSAAADALEKTAFAHELGHIIMGFSTGAWDQAVHHAFMQEHGLL
jgi:hypothetical protein